MALDRTAGFDMLVQVSETEINTQLATAFLAGGVFPTALTVPIAASGVTGTANLRLLHAIDRPGPTPPAARAHCAVYELAAAHQRALTPDDRTPQRHNRDRRKRGDGDRKRQPACRARFQLGRAERDGCF